MRSSPLSLIFSPKCALRSSSKYHWSSSKYHPRSFEAQYTHRDLRQSESKLIMPESPRNESASTEMPKDSASLRSYHEQKAKEEQEETDRRYPKFAAERKRRERASKEALAEAAAPKM